MDMNTPIALRSSNADPLALLPNAPRKAPQGKGQPSFERHLDNNQRADNAAQRSDRDDEERLDNRNDAARGDAAKDAQDAKDAKDKSKDQAADGSADAAASATPDADLIAAALPADAVTGKAETGTSETAVPAEFSLSPEQAADNKDSMPEAGLASSADTVPEKMLPGLGTSTEKTTDAGKAAGPIVETRNSTPTTIAPTNEKTAPASEQAQMTPQAATETDAKASRSQAETARPIEAKTTANPEMLTAPVDKPADAKMSMGLGHEAAAKMAQGKSAAKDNAENKLDDAKAAPRAQVAANTGPVQSTPAPASSPTFSQTMEGDAESGQITPLQANSSQIQSSNAPTIRFGTLPGHSTPTQVPAAAIALQMARNLQKGISRFDIRLDPAELGRIDVRMEVQRDGRVAAHLTVERPETLDLLQRDANALTRALNDAGLQASSDSLNFSLRDQNAGNGAAFQAATAQDRMGASNDMPEEIQGPIYNVNLSATGGVDIRV
jgi:flagellar hook-length control protein FliK